MRQPVLAHPGSLFGNLLGTVVFEHLQVGSGNPGEGEMRPQLLDRFGLKVTVSTLMDVKMRTQLVLNRMAYDKDPVKCVSHCHAGDCVEIDSEIDNRRP